MVMISNASGFEAGWLAGKYPGQVGHLYSPRGQRGPYDGCPFSLDNKRFVCWSKNVAWPEEEYLRLLTWALMSGTMPLWALVPDLVGDRDGTLREWEKWAPRVSSYGFRLAFAIQEGMTFADVPDDDCVLFIGGGDAFKDAAIKPWCARFPGRVHVGRVNGMERLLASYHAGAISVDGTGWFHKNNSKHASQWNSLNKFLRETSSHALPAST